MTVLQQIPAKAIADAIADAAERWSDADFPPRVRATERAAERTGYSTPMIEYALDRLFFGLTRETLEAVVRGEIGGYATLDGFAARAGRPDAWAQPIGRVCVVSSRTTVGVAIPPAVFALCAKCDVVVKDREDALVASFFETLAQERREFTGAARAAAWNGAAGESLQPFDAVAAFGDDETLAMIRAQLGPSARFIGYGARAGAGYVARETYDDAQAAGAVCQGAARDLVLYESEGCLSLHVLFIERGHGVTDFERALQAAIESAGVEFPPGAAFESSRGKLAHAHAMNVFAQSRGVLEAPPFFLPRALRVVRVDGPDEALAYVQQHALALEGIALAGDRADVATFGTASGAARICRFGELQQPPLAGEHGGVQRIAPFVRWVTRSR